MKRLLTLASMTLAACSVTAQTEVFVARHTETAEGPFNAGRVNINATFDGTSLGQWQDRGNSGTTGDGRVWHGFARYKMDERNLLSAIQNATTVTWTTGLIQKEKNRTVDDALGGHDVDVYLVLDPDGDVVPSGEEPTYLTAWDWSNELGWGYENTVYLGRVPQSHPMATAEEKTPEDIIPLDSPAMNITFDITEHLEAWLDAGLLTENSTIAVGLVQRWADVADDEGNPKFDDPNLYIHSQMVFEVKNAHLTTIAGDGNMGPGVFSDYALQDGWVNTGAWMGWVYVENYPWALPQALGKYIYVSSSMGWVYVPR